MENAVKTTCKLGFMLRDMNHEFCSRFVDEVLLKDKHAKAIGSNTISTRANMGAYIGEGNTHFVKYSLFGYTYILIAIVIDEAKKLLPLAVGDHNEYILEGILSRPAFYHKINCFPNEISPIRLASMARIYFSKLRMITGLVVSYTLQNGEVTRKTLRTAVFKDLKLRAKNYH